MTDTDAVRRLHATTDASVWAQEFMHLFRNCPTPDEGTMLGWFANAIETGRTAGLPERRRVIAAASGMFGPRIDPEVLAQRFHEAYERLAPSHGYATREASAVPWDQVPDRNRELMIDTVAEVTADLRAALADLP